MSPAWDRQPSNLTVLKDPILALPTPVPECPGYLPRAKSGRSTENQAITCEARDVGLSVFSGGKPKTRPDARRGLPEGSSETSSLDYWSTSCGYLESPDGSTKSLPSTGYSYGGLGQVPATSRRLYYPVEQMENRMIFGGECCSANFMGFMQGALSSGLYCVKEILEVIHEGKVRDKCE